MGKEEQQEEREVLESIYPDEIQDISETEFRILVALDTNKHEDDEAEDPTIILNVKYTENYPEEAPILDVTQPPNAAKHQHLDIWEDKTRLLDALTPTIEENLGMQMIFTLVSTLKEAAETLIAEREQGIQAQKDMEKAIAEKEENAKFEGERVTRESFLAWAESYKKELAEEAAKKLAEQEAEDKKKRGPKEEKKLTGRQLWEQGLAGKIIDEDEDGEDVDLEKMRQLSVEG